MYHVMHFLRLPGSHMVRHANAGANRKPHKQSHDHIVERTGTAYRRQRHLTVEKAHHDKVGRIVELLQDPCQDQRDCKHNDVFQKRTFRHIHLFLFCHFAPPQNNRIQSFYFTILSKNVNSVFSQNAPAFFMDFGNCVPPAKNAPGD